MFPKLGLATEAVRAYYKVFVARGIIAVVVLAQWDVPVPECSYPVTPMWDTVPFTFDGGCPVDREQVLESCVGARPCLLNEQVKRQNAVNDL